MIGKLWLRCGLAMLPLSVIPFLFVIGKDASAVGRVGIIVIAIQMLPMLGTLFPVEAALKKNFDKTVCAGKSDFDKGDSRMNKKLLRALKCLLLFIVPA